MFRLNFKIALRSLWKNKLFTFINVGGLAIGLSSCMVLLLYVAYEWNYDKQSKNYKNTYIVFTTVNSSTGLSSHSWSPGVLAPELKSKISDLALASHSSYPSIGLISYGDNMVKKRKVYADPEFLKIQDYKFLKGNPEKALKGVNVVILTETMARNLFGDEDPINKMVKLENKEMLKVEAVIADIPKNSSIVFDYLLPWSLWLKLDPELKEIGWGGNFCLTMVQLQNQESFKRANQEVYHIHRYQHQRKIEGFFLYPIEKWNLYSEFENGKPVGGKIDQVRIFLMLAFCILLIACVNFMNLSTAKSEKRAKEVGVRKAIGSSRNSLIAQFMLESVLLSVLGMLAAFVLIELSLPYINGVLRTELTIDYRDWKFWGVFTGLTLVTGVFAGSYPAFYLSSFQPVQVLKGTRATTQSSVSFRQILVVSQFVFAACLIVCTIVIYQQLQFVKNKPIGYSKNNLVELEVQGPQIGDKQKLELWKAQLLKSGAVTDVTFFSRSITLDGGNTFGVEWPGKKVGEETTFNFRSAGYDFVRTIGTVMLSGREFIPQKTDTANVIVNEAAVKAMGLKTTLGATITFWDKPVTVIGIMKDFVMESPYEKVIPMIVYYHTADFGTLVARLNNGQNRSTSVQQIKEITESLNPGFPVEVKFVDDSFEKKFQDEKLVGTISRWFGGFAIFISCLGLLGLALYMAEQRKKEISIRKVLGASNVNIVSLLNRDFIKLVGIANVIAFPIAYILISKWLAAFSFRVPVTALPFLISFCLSILIAIITVSVQSFKVAKANPVDALKYE
ncbi:ABC transporter permease [Pedobacter sp. AW31-3R]|uniref:ABC transporter permease n=1 Tax=Pedobacter sp. AW31-3R TaxID=3445781 RepID=UPI003FA149BE